MGFSSSECVLQRNVSTGCNVYTCFLVGVFVLLLSFENSLCVPFVECVVFSYFPSIGSLSFHLLSRVFSRAKTPDFDEVQFSSKADLDYELCLWRLLCLGKPAEPPAPRCPPGSPLQVFSCTSHARTSDPVGAGVRLGCPVAAVPPLPAASSSAPSPAGTRGPVPGLCLLCMLCSCVPRNTAVSVTSAAQRTWPSGAVGPPASS